MQTRGLEPLLRPFLLAAAFIAAPLISQTANAGIVTWDVDPTNSYFQLTIPDQSVSVESIGSVTIQMRDAGSSTGWSDAGGRRAALDGEIVTDYADGASITFVGGSNNLYALEKTSLRPNPADWSAATTNYTGTSTALAAMGGRVRGKFLVTFDAGYLAFRNVQFEISNVLSSPIAITNGAFAANTTCFGILTPLLDVDGLALPLGLGQPIPDLLHAELNSIMKPNAAGGTISNLGGLNRKLTYTISFPNLSMDLSGTAVTGSAAGLIIAYATLPVAPPTLSVRWLDSQLVLAWPTNGTGFSLYYATNLPAANWIAASPLPVVVNGENVVTNAFAHRAAFYRLQKP